MLVSAVRARLEEIAGTGSNAPLHAVGVAADAMAAAGELSRPVEAWVIAWDTSAAAPRAATGPVRQLVTESVMVLVGHLHVTNAASVEPEAVEEAIVDALLGWTPPGRASPMRLRGSRLLDFDSDRRILFRQVIFETERQRVATRTS